MGDTAGGLEGVARAVVLVSAVLAPACSPRPFAGDGGDSADGFVADALSTTVADAADARLDDVQGDWRRVQAAIGMCGGGWGEANVTCVIVETSEQCVVTEVTAGRDDDLDPTDPAAIVECVRGRLIGQCLAGLPLHAEVCRAGI